MCKASNDLIFLQYDITDNHSTAYKNLQFRNNKNEELHNFLNLLYRMIHFFLKKKVYTVRNEAQVSRILYNTKMKSRTFSSKHPHPRP